MTHAEFIALFGDRIVLIGALVLGVATLAWLVRRVRRIVKSERPDEPLSNLAMLIGFGWSSEAVWVLTGEDGADLPTPIRIALFAVFEVILIVFMIRTKRNVRTIDRPGRAGRNAWLVASGMSLVAVTTAHNLGEAFLRLLVPILLTSMWWDGVVGEEFKRMAGATSWRWTPRRLLLWLGAIEPGERDVETVHRERLTQQMTRLEFARRHGSEKKRERAARRLARLSLTADDNVIADVWSRVDRATWFKRPADPIPAMVFDHDRPIGPEAPAPVPAPAMVFDHDRPIGPDAPPPVAPAEVPVSDKVSVSQPPVRKRPPSSEARVIAAHRRTPAATDEELAARLGVSKKTIERYRPVKVSDNLSDTSKVNGRKPDLESVSE